MGIFQKAAILAGDLVTQPIRAKIISLTTGKPMSVKKHVEEGALMGDGSINPEIRGSIDVIGLAFKSREMVVVSNFHEKRVSWEIIEKQL